MITFDGLELKNPEPLEKEPDIALTKTRLYTGKIKIQASPEYGTKYIFKCRTDDDSDISALYAKIGYPGTLSIDGTQYTNCYIETLKEKELAKNSWQYDITIVRDTAT